MCSVCVFVAAAAASVSCCGGIYAIANNFLCVEIFSLLSFSSPLGSWWCTLDQAIAVITYMFTNAHCCPYNTRRPGGSNITANSSEYNVVRFMSYHTATAAAGPLRITCCWCSWLCVYVVVAGLWLFCTYFIFLELCFKILWLHICVDEVCSSNSNCSLMTPMSLGQGMALSNQQYISFPFK